MNLAGKAIDCVEIADQNFHNSGLILDTCLLTYERASALMDFILQCCHPKPTLLNRVMADLVRSIDEVIALGEDSNQRYVKTHHYAFMKMAMLLLDCRTASG
jgi:hypothetical protein